MTLIRRLGLALCWVLWSAGYSNSWADAALDPAQTYNTGNIVQPTTTTSGSTWTNAVYQDGVNCFGGGGPGYCGPNPIVRPDGNINFSYGSTYIYQELSTLGLFPSVTGLQIRGYDFSFTAKNGSGWDDGRTDQLSALVRFWDPTTGKAANNLVYGNSWNLSYRYDWTNFTFSETFATPYDATAIGRVQYGFIGMDNNYWAGHYGPEINNVSFNIRYGVDPCASDPLYSSTCPGYLAALQALVPVNEPVAESLPVETTTAAAAIETAPTSASTTGSEPTVQSELTRVTESAPEFPGEKKAGASLSTILSIVRSEQDRVASVESRVIEAANEQAQAATDRVTEQAVTVAESASMISAIQNMESQSTAATAATVSAGTTGSSVIMDVSQNLVRSNESDSAVVANSDSQGAALGSGLQVPRPFIDLLNMAESTQSKSNELTSARGSALLGAAAPVTEADLAEPMRFRVSATTPADNFMEAAQPAIDSGTTASDRPVNRRVADNDAAAGGVSLAAMAQQPQGYAQYSVTLQDAAFYEPREIYRGQRVVDNARALRQLSSDARHKEMVEQQYRR